MIITYSDQWINGNETSWCFFCVEHTSTIEELNKLKDHLVLLMTDNSPTHLELTGETDYEGNCAWEKLFMLFESKETLEFSEGYNGLKELGCYDLLSTEAKVNTTNDLLEWVLDQIQNHIEYLEHCSGEEEFIDKWCAKQ